MRTIKIDNEVYSYLQKKAIAFEEEPNDVLRRILGLNQVNASQKQLPTPREKPRKQLITNLKDLIREGILAEGQRLVFRHSGKKLTEYTATISGKNLTWNGEHYSMSKLAGMALETIGLDGKSVRGPIFWFTEGGKSIKDLWELYLQSHS
jgi:hypothetical protein